MNHLYAKARGAHGVLHPNSSISTVQEENSQSRHCCDVDVILAVSTHNIDFSRLLKERYYFWR